MKTTSKSRAAASARRMQGLTGDYQRIHVCDADTCARPDDVSNGRFTTPAGRVCGRCGMKVTTGTVVVERSA